MRHGVSITLNCLRFSDFYYLMKIIKGVVKDYAWGKKGISGLVGRYSLLQDGINPASNSLTVNMKLQEIQDTPFAELWMGTHPNGTSTVELGE